MCRTIEVGRAVLSSPSTNQELWLTTLITLSHQQHLIDFDQYSVDSLLSHLSSGDLWVHHGADMQIEFGLMLGKEPLARRPLETLISNILSAPAWEELNLKLSWISDPECELGNVRVSLHRSVDDSTQSKSFHRVLSNVPAADMRPPEGIPRVSLDSVQILMSIVDTKQQARATGMKRLKTSVKKLDTPAPQTICLDRETTHQPEQLDSDHSADDNAAYCESGAAGHPFGRKDGQKRKRANTSSPTIPSLGSSVLPEASNTDMFSSPANPERLVDGALRLAICGSLSKSTNGLKIKANSIHAGLAELMPEIWSPGFSLSMSTRVPLLPIISRSLSHSGGARARSLSLKEKMASLEAISLQGPFVGFTQQTSNLEFDITKITSPIAYRLWLHLRRNLYKTSTLLSSFVDPVPQAAEILCMDKSALGHTRQKGESDEIISSYKVAEHRYHTRHFWAISCDAEDELLLDTGPKV